MGGSSKSSSSSATTDNRTVLDGGGLATTGNSVGSGGSLSVRTTNITTDAGMVKDAFSHLKDSDRQNTDRLKSLINAASDSHEDFLSAGKSLFQMQSSAMSDMARREAELLTGTQTTNVDLIKSVLDFAGEVFSTTKSGYEGAAAAQTAGFNDLLASKQQTEVGGLSPSNMTLLIFGGAVVAGVALIRK
jgi:hypothetical protein